VSKKQIKGNPKLDRQVKREDRERRQREKSERLSARQKMMKDVSMRLLLVTVVILGATVALFLLPLLGFDRFPVSWFCFGVGVIGGFVSIQQRLKKLSDEDLAHLDSSWVHIIIPPFFGGVFALLFYLFALSGILEGAMFPTFAIPEFSNPPTSEDIQKLLLETYPASGQDFARLAIWSFLAGFSERLVPDILKRTAGKGSESDDDASTPATSSEGE
jgi:FtsH-binding integral membrane protein